MLFILLQKLICQCTFIFFLWFNRRFCSYIPNAGISLVFISLVVLIFWLTLLKFSVKLKIPFWKNLAEKKIFVGFHHKFDWMNWLDEYEAISGIQSITVWQYISKKVYLCETLITFSFFSLILFSVKHYTNFFVWMTRQDRLTV